MILVVFQVLTWIFKGTGLTLSSGNLINVVNQYSYILILAIGMVMVIIMGHIDLSVGSVAAFTGIVVAKAMADWNLPGRWASCSVSVSACWSVPGRGSGSPTSGCRRSS